MTSKQFIPGGQQSIKSFLSNLLFARKEMPLQTIELVTQPGSASGKAQKQQELQSALSKLLSNETLLTSGKLQFIGLSKVKAGFGRRWPEFAKIIYETTEGIIAAQLKTGDMSVRYQEDTYVLLFPHANLAEGKARAADIAVKIRQQLFDLNEAEYGGIEIAETMCRLETAGLSDKTPLEIMAAIVSQGPPQKQLLPDLDVIQVEAAPFHPHGAGPVNKAADIAEYAHYSYLPLWDTAKQALTTFICLSRNPQPGGSDFQHHLSFIAGKTPFEKTLVDLAVLAAVDAELQERQEEGRRLLVACPVQYATLFNQESYEAYKHRLSLISPERRKCLVILVMKDPATLPGKDAYWFVARLKHYCREVLVELPLAPGINFHYLADAGVETVGVRIPRDVTGAEREIIGRLNVFSAEAKKAGLPKLFMFDVPTLSLTTFAVCAGFDYLGGPAIHEGVDKPDYIYRYRHADLIADLMPKD